MSNNRKATQQGLQERSSNSLRSKEGFLKERLKSGKTTDTNDVLYAAFYIATCKDIIRLREKNRDILNKVDLIISNKEGNLSQKTSKLQSVREEWQRNYLEWSKNSKNHLTVEEQGRKERKHTFLINEIDARIKKLSLNETTNTPGIEVEHLPNDDYTPSKRVSHVPKDTDNNEQDPWNTVLRL